MGTRLHFKLIALLIVLSVIGLVVFQGYWLKGLYRSQQANIEKEVKEAMLMADYRELFERIERLKAEESILIIRSANNAMQADTAKRSTPFGTIKVEMTKDMNADTASVKLKEYLSTIRNLEDILLYTLHTYVDSLAPIDYARYDSLLHIELDKQGIHSSYQIYIRQSQSKTNAYVRLSGNPPVLAGDTVFPVFDWKDKTTFTYPVKDKSGTVICLYLASPSKVVLKQMSGILSSSLLLLLLILFAFIYLLRTILKQKTVEELKSDFTNNMTHELKTPISVSYAAIDALLDFNGSTNDKQRKYLSIAKEQLTHLSGLVEQILSLAVENRSTFRLHPESVHIRSIAESLLQQYRLKTDKPAQFGLDVADGLTVTADRTHLYNMLSNLIENALKYSDKTPCLITLKAEETPEEIRISVTDNGPGISESNQKRIFDKFFRIPNGNQHDVKGYGLGLYYVKNMMMKHRGSISLSSKPGKGATFTLHFKR